MVRSCDQKNLVSEVSSLGPLGLCSVDVLSGPADVITGSVASSPMDIRAIDSACDPGSPTSPDRCFLIPLLESPGVECQEAQHPDVYGLHPSPHSVRRNCLDLGCIRWVCFGVEFDSRPLNRPCSTSLRSTHRKEGYYCGQLFVRLRKLYIVNCPFRLRRTDELRGLFDRPRTAEFFVFV